MAEASSVRLQGLIDRLHSGDPAARQELVVHTFDRLRRLTRKMLHDFGRVRRWHDTDDVLQNAAMRLLRSLEGEPPASPAEFFGRAALHIRRELIDLARRIAKLEPPPRAGHRKEDDTSGTSAVAQKEESTWEPRRLAMWQEFHQHVEAMPVRERETFGLLWYHGMSQAEAATVLNVSVPTVKRWWLSARLRLKAALKGQRPDQ